MLLNTVGFFLRNSVFEVALQCDKTVEGTVDPVVSDVLFANKYVSTQYDNYNHIRIDRFFFLYQ